MRKDELNKKFIIFGSQKDVWGENLHISHTFSDKNTICGENTTRIENLAKIGKLDQIGCKKCIDLYKIAWRMATEEESDVLAFLNAIREEGKINMFGAGKVIAEMFDLQQDKAKKYLQLWIENFNHQVDYLWVYDSTIKK